MSYETKLITKVGSKCSFMNGGIIGYGWEIKGGKSCICTFSRCPTLHLHIIQERDADWVVE